MPITPGSKIHRWTVLSFHEKRGRSYYWLCKCDCGNEKVVCTGDLTRRRRPTKSCGCLVKEAVSRATTNRNLIHGLSSHPLYILWGGMKNRCTYKSNREFHVYGGRGIKVCDEWLLPNGEGFINFYNWSIDKWEPGLTINRINNDGNYEPSNCNWLTRKQQANNKSTNRIVSVHGHNYSVKEAIERFGVKKDKAFYCKVRYRLDHGWEIEKALLTP